MFYTLHELYDAENTHVRRYITFWDLFYFNKIKIQDFF